MTSFALHPMAPAPAQRAQRGHRSTIAAWPLQDAKTRFSELVRQACTAGPQHVSLHGRPAVVVVAAQEFSRMQGQRTGLDLIQAMQQCPDADWALAPERTPMPVREVEL